MGTIVQDISIDEHGAEISWVKGVQIKRSGGTPLTSLWATPLTNVGRSLLQMERVRSTLLQVTTCHMMKMMIFHHVLKIIQDHLGPL